MKVLRRLFGGKINENMVITKGMAGNIICRMREGAGKEWKLEKEREKREEKLEERERETKRKWEEERVIKVGPIGRDVVI